MSQFEVIPFRLDHGVWEGRLSRPEDAQAEPGLEARYRGEVIADLIVSAAYEPGAWDIRLTLPAAVLSDGVHSVLLVDRDSGQILYRIDIAAGQNISEDLRSEVALLREELDMLKRSFRRHCRES